MSSTPPLPNKKELLFALSETHNIPVKVIRAVLSDYQRVILRQLKEHGEAKILDLGKIKVAETKERTGYNPKDKTRILIPQKKVARMSFSKQVKEYVKSDEEYPSFAF